MLLTDLQKICSFLVMLFKRYSFFASFERLLFEQFFYLLLPQIILLHFFRLLVKTGELTLKLIEHSRTLIAMRGSP